MAEKEEKTFKQKWLEDVNKKGSILCAGLDPAEYEMGRREKGLPSDVGKLDWSRRYIDAVAPYCPAIKFNLRYWLKQAVLNRDSESKDFRQISGDMENLRLLIRHAHDQELLVIQDSKEADIGSTNDAGLYHARDKQADAVTLAAFAGNEQEATEQAYNRDLGIIGMCLMTNPQYEKIKNMWVDVSDNQGDYAPEDTQRIQGKLHVRRYMQLACDARRFGLDGIVLGALSEKNHLKEKEIAKARFYAGPDVLSLTPGIGAQGGNADVLFKYFHQDKIIANIGRALMLPQGSNSTSQQQEETAKQYRDMLNNLREKSSIR
jgi:orotidine-5'-phosphate decarboxylase